MDFLWSTHPAFCGIHKLETLFLQYQGRKLGPINIPVITALVWTEQGFTQVHTLLSAILLHPLQKPLTVAKAKAQRGDLNLETAIWALSHRFVPWGFSTASHAPSVQKPVPSCTVPLHVLQHFVPVWLTQGFPLCFLRILTLLFLSPNLLCWETLPILLWSSRKQHCVKIWDVPLWQYYLILPSPDSGLAPLFIIPLDRCQAAVLLTSHDGTATLLSLWALKRVWSSLDMPTYSVTFWREQHFRQKCFSGA